MNHFPSINAISASICLLGCGLALPVFSQQPEKGKPDAAHISKTKADWWSQRHALLKQTLAETPCQLLFIGDSITHRWETDGKKIWSQYFSPYAPVNFGIGGDRTEHVLWRIDDSALKTPHSPQVCVIMVGTNNTGQYKGRQTPQETAEGTRRMESWAWERTRSCRDSSFQALNRYGTASSVFQSPQAVMMASAFLVSSL